VSERESRAGRQDNCHGGECNVRERAYAHADEMIARVFGFSALSAAGLKPPCHADELADIVGLSASAQKRRPQG
jgi:hypothetical protein